MGANNSRGVAPAAPPVSVPRGPKQGPPPPQPKILPDFTFSSGFVTGILISIIFLVLSWYVGTINERAGEFYSGMMCKFVQ